MEEGKPKQERDVAPARRHYLDPFSAMRAEMDQLLNRFFGGGRGDFVPSRFATLLGSSGGDVVPSMDVKETDKEVVVSAELPGLSEKDIELTLKEGILTLKGEKKEESKSDEDNVHVMERRYGSFQRAFRLPGTIDEGKIDAQFEKGVLTVTVPKRPEAVKAEKKIAIKAK